MAQEGAVRRRLGCRLRPAATHGGGHHEEEFERERNEVEPPLRTREEVAYYRIFAEDLGEVSPKRTIGRFATA